MSTAAPGIRGPAGSAHQKAREAAQARSPSGEFGVALAGLRVPAALRTTLAALADARAAMGPDHAGRPDVQFAATLELGLALLADALAGSTPTDPTARTLRLIATAAHQLSTLYAERLHRTSAPAAKNPERKAA